MNYLLVFIGGGLGSLLRFGIGKISLLKFFNFPLASFISNIIACLLFGLFFMLLQKYPKHDWISPLLLVGICGGFSTFSTFSYENVALMQQGQFGLLLLNVVLSVAVGFFGVYLFISKA